MKLDFIIKFFFAISFVLFFFDSAFCRQIAITAPSPVGTSEQPTVVKGKEVKISWRIDNTPDMPAVVQIYLNEKLIFPKEDVHKESSPGLAVPLSPGTYEIKLWIPRTMINSSTWVRMAP